MDASLTAPPRRNALAVVALLLGAVAIATSPLFVRVSETGPVATAFWRAFLALPVLWLWSAYAQRSGARADAVSHRGRMAAAGLLFAGDLAFWHWSIMMTSVANATLLANLAPIFVALGAWLLLRKHLSGRFLVGLFTALTGMVVLIGGDFKPTRTELLGDVCGVITAMFYAGYQMTITRLRERIATGTIMAWSVSFTAAALLPVALLSGDSMLPATAIGWLTLIGLALIAQAAGQSLIAYAMAHLPGTFSSVGLLFQPVMAALFAWALLGEAMGWLQIAGGIAVLIGIRIAHEAEAAR